MKQYSASSSRSPKSSFPASVNRLPATVLVLLPSLVLLSLLSLWKGETDVTLACIGGILSLLKNNQPPPHIPKNPDAPPPHPPTTRPPPPTGRESPATH